MEVLTTTPFGQRPVTAGLIERARAAQKPAELPHFNKWEIFRELCVARAAYGLSDRDLTVLNALLSFHREANLSDNDSLIVFPSNRALSERAHGMAESTLRRHLAALVGTGLILRHDSPNGKRYAARAPDGSIARAFGFDLRPLLVNAPAITHAAAEVRAAAERLRRTREDVVLMKRDALKLIEYGRTQAPDAPWESVEADMLALHRRMRRKLDLATLEGMRADVRKILTRVQQFVSETEEMGGNDVDIERHYTNSNTDSHDSELIQEKDKGTAGEPSLPLALVLKACPDILPYAPDKPKHWHELVALAGFVRGMMGISPDAWAEAQRVMGPEIAAVTLAGILQRIGEIKSPGGYLRALTRKAETGGFSPGPMIMALLRSES